MTQRNLALGLALLGVLACARPAMADGTAFLGLSPTPDARQARGAALGISLLVVGFEFEYSQTAADLVNHTPSLTTGMLNGLVQTPTKTQLYLTAGGGFYRERLGTAGETNVGTNIGGGIKIALAGPIRLRLDYRVFNLRGSPAYKNPQRLYGGLNLAF